MDSGEQSESDQSDIRQLRECQDCGLLQRLPLAGDGALVDCQRCGALLSQVRERSLVLTTASATLGLLLLVLAFAFPLASMIVLGGRYAEANLSSSVVALAERGSPELTLAVAAALVAFPALKMFAVIAMVVSSRLGSVSRPVRRLFTAIPWLSSWAMIDVFLLGAMISLFRLRSWGHLDFGFALIALAGASLCSLTLDASLDSARFWELARSNEDAHESPQRSSRNTIDPSAFGCSHCSLVVRGDDGRCPRCAGPLHRRKNRSVARTWAFVAAGALLLLPANLLPVMTVTQMTKSTTSTIWHGIVELKEAQLYGLALIVFVASLVVPILKLVALAVLLIMTKRGSAAFLTARTRVYRVVAIIGRWSMIDIFATMMLVALARFGSLGEVLPGAGASAFCAVVIVTMMAAEAFDPRLMWDAAGANSESDSAKDTGSAKDEGPVRELRAEGSPA